ncbi:MAG TPA: hypothetical protein VL221_10570 [Bacteroidota bacterium]|nr:hypothetical protein [Bacteroidota bacterium]
MNNAVILLLASAAIAGCAREQSGAIAFQSNRDGNFEIYTMDGTGGAPTRLTENPSNDIAPTWSPDGTRIAFASDRDGTWDIYTMGTDGSGLRQLTQGAGANTAPSWTASGERIVFISTRDAVHGDVYAMNPDGSNTVRLTADSLVKDTPLMTPDGKTLVVTVNTRGRLSLGAIALPAGTCQPLTGNDHDSFAPALSPRGSEIMFVSDRDGSLQIYAMDVDGQHTRRLTTDGVDERFPAYTATPGVILVAKKGGISLLTLETGKERVLSYRGDYAPSWHTR